MADISVHVDQYTKNCVVYARGEVFKFIKNSLPKETQDEFMEALVNDEDISIESIFEKFKESQRQKLV